MKTQELLTKTYKILKDEGIDSYILDCQLLLGKVLNLDRMSIIMNKDQVVDDEKVNEYLKLIEKRKNKMPIKYILGTAEFMGIDFYIKEGVLIPRPDTEVLVEQVLEDVKKNKYTSVCDVCSGSGVIGLSLAKSIDNLKVDLYDISEIAEEVTNTNIERLSLENRAVFIRSDLLEFAILENKRYEVIVSNPPYIKTSVIPTLMEDVKDYEPYIALWGGEDGLDFYRKITEQSLKLLVRGGMLSYEIGHDQEVAVKEIMTNHGFIRVQCIYDLAGNPRVVKGFLD